MSKQEIKEEINRVLEQLSNEALGELLTFLKKIETKQEKNLSSELISKILQEDKTLLTKLAQ